MIIEPLRKAVVGRREALIRHELAGCAEFDVAKLDSLARMLPADWVRAYDVSGAPVVADVADDSRGRPMLGAHSLRLLHVEFVPPFRTLIPHCYESMGASAAAAREGGLAGQSSILFIGSSGATTPTHLDHHHNLLFQVRGTKRVTVSRFEEGSRQRREVERAFAAMGACVSTPTLTTTYVLHPGDGIYLPPYTFHSAKVLDGDVSVALSCAFSTPATERAYRVHRGHQALRRVHLPSPATGESRVGDALQDWLGRGLQRVRPAAV